MPEFTTQCPFCGFSFSTDESCVGVTTTCASCSKDFVIQPNEGTTSKNGSSQIRPDQILVTSGDLNTPYDVVGMVCFTVGTRGEMRNVFESLKTSMAYKLAQSKGQISQAKSVGQFIGGVGFDSAGDVALTGQYAGASFNSSDLEIAFHIAVNQLQLRASYLNANGIVGFRYDLDFDSNANVLNFMATAFGTAVRLAS
jgi:uncharacterized protein YbjQ (UPF0145 family)